MRQRLGVFFCLASFIVLPRWTPGKFLYNMTHNSDVSTALWRCATWIDEVGGRKKADEEAGEVIYSHTVKKHIGGVEGIAPPQNIVKAPLFHLVRPQSIVLSFDRPIESNSVGQSRPHV